MNSDKDDFQNIEISNINIQNINLMKIVKVQNEQIQNNNKNILKHINNIKTSNSIKTIL